MQLDGKQYRVGTCLAAIVTGVIYMNLRYFQNYSRTWSAPQRGQEGETSCENLGEHLQKTVRSTRNEGPTM